MSLRDFEDAERSGEFQYAKNLTTTRIDGVPKLIDQRNREQQKLEGLQESKTMFEGVRSGLSLDDVKEGYKTLEEAREGLNESLSQLDFSSLDFSNLPKLTIDISKSATQYLDAVELLYGGESEKYTEAMNLVKRFTDPKSGELIMAAAFEKVQEHTLKTKHFYENLSRQAQSNVDFLNEKLFDISSDGKSFGASVDFAAKVLEDSSINLRNAGLNFATEFAKAQNLRTPKGRDCRENVRN